MNRYWVTVLALAAALVFAAPLSADKPQDRDHDKDHGKGHAHADRDRGQDDERWERREGYEYRTYEHNSQPPGWSKGKKTGWGNCGVPPGQAKKGRCRAYTYNGRTHYYYRDEQGRYVVRRQAEQEHGERH